MKNTPLEHTRARIQKAVRSRYMLFKMYYHASRQIVAMGTSKLQGEEYPVAVQLFILSKLMEN